MQSSFNGFECPFNAFERRFNDFECRFNDFEWKMIRMRKQFHCVRIICAYGMKDKFSK